MKESDYREDSGLESSNTHDFDECMYKLGDETQAHTLMFLDPHSHIDRITLDWVADQKDSPEVLEHMYNLMVKWQEETDSNDRDPFIRVMLELLVIIMNNDEENVRDDE